MSYKHKNDVIDAADFMKPSYAEGKHKAIQVEVDEVYRKAKTFDQLRVIIEMSMQKDSMYHYYDDHGAFGVDYEVLVEDLQSIIEEADQ